MDKYDKDKNAALSFAEFIAMIQNKPWSALLRRVFPHKASVSVTQVAALGSKKEGFMNPTVRASLQKLFDSVDVDGSLEIRDGVPQCCFRRCKVPFMYLEGGTLSNGEDSNKLMGTTYIPMADCRMESCQDPMPRHASSWHSARWQ